MKTRPVFENFQEFVNFMTESIESDYYYEDYLLEEEDPGEPTIGGTKLDSLKNDFKGIFGKDPAAAKTIEEFGNYFQGFISSEDASFLQSCVDNITKFTGRKEENKITLHSYDFTHTNGGEYDWLFSGTCKASAYPIVGKDGKVTRSDAAKDKEYMPIGELLLNINKANLKALSDALEAFASNDNKKDAEAELKKLSNQGVKGKDGILGNLYRIDNASLKDQIIQVKQYERTEHDYDKLDFSPKKAKQYTGFLQKLDNMSGIGFKTDNITKKYTSAYEYGFLIPIYYVDPSFTPKNSKNKIGEEEWTRVLPASGSSFKVEDKPFSPDPSVEYFRSNKTELTNSGKADIKAFISKFNKIDKIVVNAGASAFSTSYTSPNKETQGLKAEIDKLAKDKGVLANNVYLAYDRMLSGVAELEALKKEGVEQLAETKIEKSTLEQVISKVQKKDEGGDVKAQQVIFDASGYIKNIEQESDNEPVILKGVNNVFAKKIKLAIGTLDMKLVINKPLRTKTKTTNSNRRRN